MINRKFIFRSVLIYLCCVQQFAFAARYTINAEVWARPRSGEVILQMEPLRNLVADWQQSPNSVIEILYPGGEAGVLWAQELQSWLVALGIPSARIQDIAGSTIQDSIEVRLRAP